jgi:hypothetical protein
LGIRWNEVDRDVAFSYKARDIKKALTGVQRDLGYYRNRFDSGAILQEKFDSEYARLNEAYRANIRSLISHADGMKRKLKATDDDLVRLFKENAIGPKTALDVLDGIVRDVPEKKQPSISDIYEEKYLSLPTNKMLSQISKDFKEDPFRRKDLVEHHKSIVRAERLKLSPRDRLVMSLNNADRTTHILEQMRASSDPDSVLKGYLRKGMINDEIYFKIRNAKESY